MSAGPLLTQENHQTGIDTPSVTRASARHSFSCCDTHSWLYADRLETSGLGLLLELSLGSGSSASTTLPLVLVCKLLTCAPMEAPAWLSAPAFALHRFL